MAESKYGAKHENFQIDQDGKFECLICRKKLASKQRVLNHLHSVHGLTPVKRLKKKYVEDESAAVPRSTFYRWKKKGQERNARRKLYDTSVFVEEQQSSAVFAEHQEHNTNTEYENKDNSVSSSEQHSDDVLNEVVPGNDCNLEHSNYDFVINEVEPLAALKNVSMEDAFKGSKSPSKIQSVEQTLSEDKQASSSPVYCYDENSSPLSVDFELHNSDCSSGENDVISEDEHMSVPNSVASQDVSDTLSSENEYASGSENNFTDSESDISTISMSVDEWISCPRLENGQNIPIDEFQALSLFSCFLRNKFSASTSRDVIDTLKRTFPHLGDISNLDFNQMMSYIDTTPLKEVHYCLLCNTIFPEDRDIFQCQQATCNGLRYKGPISSQLTKGRQPRQYFVMADVKSQLVDLLQFEEIFYDIQQNKAAAYERATSGCKIITDIMDGSAYQKIVTEGFLDRSSHNITAVFNTDGVNLYSSSKIELWPIYLAINELSPSKRYSRDNILLVALWQGKGKPPFKSFFKVFSEDMNQLYLEGVQVTIRQCTYNVKLAVLCCIADLPAKAEVLNMSYFNGEYACIACEEPGITVRQGKGNARCLPYRMQGARYPSRRHENVLQHMRRGTHRNRMKGFKGLSGLSELENFNLVQGTVPEYMHGALLGVTKRLLSKWFSPSESRKEYFIGQHLKEISERMQNIKPPDSIERLPRDLEKHYNHFKATELQSWLLYYAIPCLRGLLPDRFMENLCCLSEGIYILLGDHITDESIEKANDLLDQFYSSFQGLYGDGSCGLNVHNIGNHLCSYVKLWGPLWAWSCFPFEDANASLLQAVHGTGLVLKQVMNYRQAQSCIRKKGLDLKKTCSWKVTHDAMNCDVAGAIKQIKETEMEINMVQQLKDLHNPAVKFKKMDRVIVNDIKFCSEQYSRMQKRICNVVLYGDRNVGIVKYFILCNDFAYAVIQKLDQIPSSQQAGAPILSHLIQVETSDIKELEGSPYSGGIFWLRIDFTADYPFKPPKILFQNQIYHPNIEPKVNGKICVDFLQSGWKPSFSIGYILMAICSLLLHPNADEPVDQEIAKKYLNQKEEFDKIAKEWTQSYAKEN